jgi:hypothetical protein
VVDEATQSPISNATVLVSRSSKIVSESTTNATGVSGIQAESGDIVIVGKEDYLSIAKIVRWNADFGLTFELRPLITEGMASAVIFSDHQIAFDKLMLVTDSSCMTGVEEVPHWHSINSTVEAIDGTILEDPDPNGCGFGKESDVEVVSVMNQAEGEVVISANITETTFDHIIDSSPCPQVFATISLTASQGGTWAVSTAPVWLNVNFDRNIAIVEFNCNVDEFVPQSLIGTINLDFKTTQGNIAGTVPVAVIGRLLAQ